MTDCKMTYRFLGNSGLLVSKLARLVEPRYTAENWCKLMTTAFKHGVNFFDNSENYADGYSEEIMGLAIKRGIDEGVWAREDLVLSTKVCFGVKGFVGAGSNGQGRSRKHLVEGVEASLKRLGLVYVDVVFCHRQEPFTPIEQTVRAMNFLITRRSMLSSSLGPRRPSETRWPLCAADTSKPSSASKRCTTQVLEMF